MTPASSSFFARAEKWRGEFRKDSPRRRAMRQEECAYRIAQVTGLLVVVVAASSAPSPMGGPLANLRGLHGRSGLWQRRSGGHYPQLSPRLFSESAGVGERQDAVFADLALVHEVVVRAPVATFGLARTAVAPAVGDDGRLRRRVVLQFDG